MLCLHIAPMWSRRAWTVAEARFGGDWRVKLCSDRSAECSNAAATSTCSAAASSAAVDAYPRVAIEVCRVVAFVALPIAKPKHYSMGSGTRLGHVTELLVNQHNLERRM